MKRTIVCVLILSVIIFLFFGCSKTLARVDGMDIKEKEVDIYINFLKNQDTSGEIASDEEKLNTLKASIIDSLIVIKLLEKYAEENNITVTDEEVNQQITQIITSYSSEQDFKNDLKANGIDQKFLESELKSQLLRNKIIDKVTADVTVTDEEVKQYYDDNKNTLFLVPVSVKASHILVMFPWIKDSSVEESEEGRKEAREKIEMIEQKLEAGANFEDMARQYSDDETTAENGGDLGYISKGQMVEEFDNALFSLDVGEVSGIVETEYGYHIIKVYDRKESYIQKFDEVEESINSYLLNSYKSSKWEDFIYSLIDKVDIEYFTDVEGTLNDTGTEEQGNEIPTQEEGSETSVEQQGS